MKFKVGDIVVGNKKASEEYSITVEGVVMEVVWPVDVDSFEGKILSHPVGIQIGNTYKVLTSCFDLETFSVENE